MAFPLGLALFNMARPAIGTELRWAELPGPVQERFEHAAGQAIAHGAHAALGLCIWQQVADPVNNINPEPAAQPPAPQNTENNDKHRHQRQKGPAAGHAGTIARFVTGFHGEGEDA